MKYDAVIVGSGAGGGTSAWALSREGMKVLVLEAGPRYKAATDYKLHTPEWESPFPYKTQHHNNYSVTGLQTLDARNSDIRSWNHISGQLNPNAHRVSYGYHHVQGVGGSSLHFTGEAHRLNSRSMKLKSEYGVGADWPFTYDDLEPYYAQAEDFVGVAGPTDTPFRHRSTNYPETPHPLSYASQKLQSGFEALGMSTVPNSLAVLSTPRDGRGSCNQCGGCLRGCPIGDKGSIDITYLRAADATNNCTIKANCTVTRIETDTQDKIKGVHYVENGKHRYIETPRLIIAAGAIQTPRLLLSSKDASSPDGLCNESGEVGKNFMETLLWTSTGLHKENLGSHRGLPVDMICWDYNSPDAIPDVVGGCRFGPAQGESDLVGPVNYAKRVVKGWGLSHKHKMRTQIGTVLSVAGISESLPHPQSFIRLSTKKDKFGVPLAEIHSYVDDMAVRRIRFMANTARAVLKAAGAERIIEEFSSYDIFSSTHVFGTCRMGLNPNDSVVNEWCQSHRWKNLYIVDASVFPSSGGGESPGLTIQALALRTAAHINGTKQ